MWISPKNLFRQAQQAPDSQIPLPNEILLNIFEHLDLNDLQRLGQTCRQMHALTNRVLPQRSFPSLLKENVPPDFFSSLPRIDTKMRFEDKKTLHSFMPKKRVFWGLDGCGKLYLLARYTLEKSRETFVLYQDNRTWKCLDTGAGKTAYVGEGVHWKHAQYFFPNHWDTGINCETAPFIQAFFKGLNFPTPITTPLTIRYNLNPKSAIHLA